MSIGTDKDIEEERRLFYVAITRAKERVTLSNARNRYKWGNLESSRPSRFIEEIDDDYLEYPQNAGLPFSKESGSQWSQQNKKRGYNLLGEPGTELKTESHKRLSRISSKNDSQKDFHNSDDITAISEGSMVVHKRFGNGKVIAIDGNPPNTTATVDFEKHGVKKLLLRFAKLKLV